MFFHFGSTTPIPELFHSVYLDGPFTQCIDCECSFANDGTAYLINKNFVGSEAIFEMAMCLNCLQTMQAQYSRETVANIRAYFAAMEAKSPTGDLPGSENTAVEETDQAEFTWEEGVRACYLCQRLREQCRRYEIVGACVEDRLLVSQKMPGLMRTPMMICSDCQEEISKLISQTTRDLWDRFMEDHFPGPPGIELDSPNLQPVFF